MSVVIRKFTHKDAEETCQLIRNTLFTVNIKEYTREQLEEVAQGYTPEKLQTKTQSHIIFVVEKNGKIVGTAAVQDDFIKGVFVSAEHMRQGIGSQLMMTVEKEAVLHGFQSVYLFTSITARAFYKKLGYQDDEKEKFRMYKDLRR